ncbi:hypothetical protein [Agromyces atrinae]|uniref:Uncharacterized protein n=1 Tax=Agromyces atrinae TaxID=592376 RepID=A0A4Q2M4B5_9MICO|nr:hypothetical protein [Agromyces atrinae]NYD68702.1 hypothetical protein [Agromyces atrinae]RXZ86067.1 hypothetical protein ESP50_12765 [Agromyces atrinae]
MALPLIPLVIVVGSAAAATGGVVVGAVGGAQIRLARVKINAHAARYEKRHGIHLIEVERTNAALRAFGQVQEAAQRGVIFRMRDFLERHAKQVRAHEHLILDGVDGSNTRVVGLAKLDPDVAGWVRGVVGSVIAGGATPVAMRAAATNFAKASTGTAIKALSGAAAQNATLAFLGGGSLVSGGGGVKLGGKMLNVAMIGPSILVLGVTVKTQGTKARTEAVKHHTEVDVAVAELDARDQILAGVQSRARELQDILLRLSSQATDALNILESETYDNELHAGRLQTALILVKSVRDVATASIADEDGQLDEDAERLFFKYRDTTSESKAAADV